MVNAATSHVPERSCRVCRTKKPKSQLKRWALQGTEAVADSAQSLPGRGVYTCSEACYAKIQKQLPHILTSKKALKPA